MVKLNFFYSRERSGEVLLEQNCSETSGKLRCSKKDNLQGDSGWWKTQIWVLELFFNSVPQFKFGKKFYLFAKKEDVDRPHSSYSSDCSDGETLNQNTQLASPISSCRLGERREERYPCSLQNFSIKCQHFYCSDSHTEQERTGVN